MEQMALEETQALETEPVVRKQALTDAWHEALRAQRSALTELFREDVISEVVYNQMIAETDALLEDEDNWPEIRAVLNPESLEEEGTRRRGNAGKRR
jgi:hypothetical protein